MRRAKLHSIDEHEHFWQYAEWNWVDRTTDYLAEDEHWSFKICIVCFFVWLGVALWPWVARLLP